MVDGCLKVMFTAESNERPSIGGPSGLLQHPFLQPQGERAMQLFQAAALGNENMQDVVRQVLKTVDDPIWKKEGSIDKICHVEISEEYDG